MAKCVDSRILFTAFLEPLREHFLPICFFEFIYHVLGIAEVWYILSRISDATPSLLTTFLFESVSRLVTIIFKLVPFVIGVDEAGAAIRRRNSWRFGAGVAVTLAIIREGRILFWTAIGVILILTAALGSKSPPPSMNQ